jgi:two-component system, cell cycle response regulator
MPSEPGLQLPYDAATGIKDPCLSLKPDAPARCPVLIVDDDELVVASLAALLSRADYDVYRADSAEAALRILSVVPCRMVITDWQMPDMDGLALCRCLRSRTNGSYIYILLLSIRKSKQDTLAGLAAGADDYIVKGAPPEEILARANVGRRITLLEHSLRISNRENRRLSVTDSLTGVRNRRYLMKYLPREIARSRRHQHPLAVLSCDVDRFKQVNDQFGHEAGDEVLRELALRFTSCIREATDWIARMGGEEFMIVLPETNLSGASCVAEKVRSTVSAHPFATRSGPLAVTVSIGATALETLVDFEAVSLTELLRTADRCLYTSKNLGRDRATAAPPVPSRTANSATTVGACNEIN